MDSVILNVIELDDHLMFNGSITATIDSYISLIWNEQYYGMDEFELRLPLTDRYVNALTMGNMIVRMRNGMYEGDEHPMLIENIVVSYVEDVGEILVVSGRGMKSILSRRVVWETQVLKGKIQDAIEATLQNQLVLNYTIGNPKFMYIPYTSLIRNKYEDIETTAFGKKLSEWIVEICQSKQIGWKITTNRSQYDLPDPEHYGKYYYWLQFILYDGVNHTSSQSENPKVIFSKANNNLLNFEYKYSKQNYANRIMIAGEGEGVNQSVAEYSYDSNAQGINIYEAYIDGSSVKSDIVILENEYLALLRSYGKEQTNVNKVCEFSCNVDGNTTYKLGEDYKLGDLVEVETDIGVRARARIIEMIYSYDENGYTVVPTFSDWEVV